MRVLVNTGTWFGVEVESILREAGLLVTTADDGAELLACLDYAAPAAILADFDLPDTSWRALAGQIRHRNAAASVLSICSARVLEDEVRALSQGADDVLAPRMGDAEVVTRVLRVVARRAGFGATILRLGGLTLDTGRQRALWAANDLLLRGAQYQILEHLVLKHGNLVERSDLLDLLYGIDDAADIRTIGVFLYHLRKKLAAGGAPDNLVGSIRGRGVYLADPERRKGWRPETTAWFDHLRQTA